MSQQHDDWLAGLLLQEGLCASLDEAEVIADVILEEMKDRNIDFEDSSGGEMLQQCLQEHLPLLASDASVLAAKLLRGGNEDTNRDHEGNPENEGNDIQTQNDEGKEEEEDGVALFDGECELCDRYIKLTKHHLIPKSTWPRIETRLMHAVKALESEESDKAAAILSPGLMHLMEDLPASPDKLNVRYVLHRTCNICRPCHSAVHKAHDNMELALSYSTIDFLLQDPQIAKFCKWASKQRAGKYAVT